ncbi:hypothetical protein GCM10009733_077330 [Nonomuraea maheshkhaliensis]|uniref:Uncharacterized protein n=1 Tax=Nonomuraea maheshkhaliensis TaxID=419590 RepID=A0ABP4S9T3_9ACTN
MRGTPIRVHAISPGFCATDLNGHRGVLSADEGGRRVARLVTLQDAPTGTFLDEPDGILPW